MAAQQVVVVGVGMMTAVGLTAAETTASVRASMMGFTETSIRDHQYEPFTLAEVPEEGLPALHRSLAELVGPTSRELRMLRLASPALVECLGPMKANGVRPPLMLALPEAETTLELDRPAFLQWLARQSDGGFDPAQSSAEYTGRAGGLMAIGRAAELIRSQHTDFALAGGVDTYRDLYVLGTLDMEQRVKSEAHLDGFIPGEGAGFVLLASPAMAARAKLAPLASLSIVAQGFENGHLYSEEPYRGDGLSSVVLQLVQSGALPAPIQEVYSSMNGENHWAKEWGVSFIRNSAAFEPDHGFHHPADCFGDTGAACGPLMLGLSALGVSGGYRGSPGLVYCSSDRGDRAALIMSAFV
jgi:3-oxoacyl-[acyl-carrier-protein] synthase I